MKTVEDARLEKAKLERTIASMLKNFENEFGVKVKHVGIVNSTEIGKQPKIREIQLEVCVL